MKKKAQPNLEYFVISELGDRERGVAGPFKTEKQAIDLRKLFITWETVTESYVVRKI
jgi:hypothetical protein